MNLITAFFSWNNIDKDPNIGRDPNRVPIPLYKPPKQTYQVVIPTFEKAREHAKENFARRVHEIVEKNKKNV
jgi:hypothetical protein